MGFVDRLRAAWAAMMAADGGVALPLNGRSSDESLPGMMSAFLAGFGSVSPVVNFEMLKTLKCFAIYNADFSQYVANIVNLGNPGHSLQIDAASDATAEKAVNRLNESSQRIYDNACGVDGLINQLLWSVAWSGAVSSEDVVNIAGRRVERVALVPVEQIRFRYNKDLDRYEPYQRSNNLTRRDNEMGLIKLNPETYKYYALSTIENSPYAKPPATAVVEPILEGQQPLMENLRYIAKKFGLLGFVTAAITPPRKLPSESESEYQTRKVTYLADVVKAFQENFGKGMVGAYNDVEVKHTNVSEGATGFYDANRMSEEQIMSGFAMPPAFFGRTDSTTETFAEVVYSLLTAQVTNMQRLPKRRMEQTYRLDLRLAGIDVDGVGLKFNKTQSRNAKAEAETEQIRFADVLARVKAGLISPDEGAQEMGEDAWFDDTLLFSQTGILPQASGQLSAVSGQRMRRTIKLSFDRDARKYRYLPDVIYLGDGDEGGDISNLRSEISKDGTVVPFESMVKKKAAAAAASN